MNFVTVLLIILPALVTAQLQLTSNSRFMVVAPYVIRQGKPFNIYARGFNLTSPLTLTIRLTGQSDAGVALNIARVANLSPTAPRAAFTIATTTIQKGTYSFVVEGDNNSQSRKLTYVTKKYAFTFQLNKDIYLQNDVLQYRIYAVDSETFAVNPREPNNVTITDPKRNIVTTVKNVVFTKGKYENKFQLAPKAMLGDWTVTFQMGDEFAVKVFKVAEYKLPIVSAKLVIQQFTAKSAGKVPITVDVSYAFSGNPVGSAQVNISLNDQLLLTKNIQISSAKTTFEVDMATELQYSSAGYAYYLAKLYFEDSLTGEKANDEHSFGVQANIYNIYINGYNMDSITPGRPFKFVIAVRKSDGSPAPAGTRIQVIPEESAGIPEQTLFLGVDGRVISSVDVPIYVTLLKLRVVVNLTDVIEGGVVFGKPIPQPGSYLYVLNANEACYYDTSCIKLNQPIKIKLISSDAVDFAIVHITSKGVLLKSLTVRFDSDLNEDNDPKTVYFTFTPTIWYPPYIKILAYYFTDDWQIVMGENFLYMPHSFPNYVKIRPSTHEVRPGSNATFNVESYVNSTVSLVAIDQRALLMNYDGSIPKIGILNDFHIRWTFFERAFDWDNIETYEYRFSNVGLLVLSNIPRGGSPMLSSTMGGEFEALSTSVSADSTDVQVREKFMETFLWRDVDIKNNLYDDIDFTDETTQFGYESISEKVPDTISKYYIYGVSMSPTKGIGVSEDIPYVSVFLPFFISVEFPYSVRRFEILTQEIIIYNYLAEVQTVEVKITSDPKYDAIDLATYGWTAIPGFYTKTVTTTVGQHVELQFGIKPKVTGFIPFEVTARGPIAGDALVKQLRVIPDGVSRTITRNVFIPIESSAVRIQQTLQCNLPASAYQDTTEISATVTGDLFGKALKNIGRLIQLPTGSCEGVASNLIPNIVIHLYLSATNKLTTDLKTKLESNIAIGYQSLLSCQNSDGSYSIFSDGVSSNWVTAYVIQYLNLASDIVTVDPNIVSRGADYLILQQNADGSFNETGTINYGFMQAGSSKGIALTAFCSIVFSSLLLKYPQYATVRDNAITYLEAQFGSVTSTYELGIIAYAFQLAGSTRAGTAYNSFNARRIETVTDIYWKASNTPSSYQQTAISPDVEITSYGLMTLLSRGEALPRIVKVVQYIAGQSNLYGGYGSSYDTVIALNALSQFAKTYALNGTVTVAMTPNVGTAFTARVTPANMLTLQTLQMNSTARSLIARASSTTSGLAIVSLTCNFYEDPSRIIPQFGITYNITKFCRNRMEMAVCVKYKPTGISNMAFLVVTMPSGFYASFGPISTDVKLVEQSYQGSEMTFYFNSISNEGTCVEVKGYSSTNVAELRGGIIQVFDNYDTSKYGAISYSISNAMENC